MISDNNHITYTAEDIQRYWNGQLSPQEMHAMEKAALDDPFLADAMEGMGMAMQQHGEMQMKSTLAGMHQQLEDRVAGNDRKTKVVAFHWWKIVAAACVLLVAGYWIFSSASSEKNGLAKNEDQAAAVGVTNDSDKQNEPGAPAEEAVADSNETFVSVEKSQPKDNTPIEFGTRTDKNQPAIARAEKKEEKADETRQNEFPALQEKTGKAEPALAQKAAAVPPSASAINLDSIQPKVTEVVTLEDELNNAVAGMEVKKEAAKDEPKLQNVIQGIVTDNRNNPLANVFIRPDNNNQVGYVTDMTGQFRIPAKDTVVSVLVSSPGYATQRFQLRSTHSEGNIAQNKIQLQNENESLSEVVVAGYGHKRKAAKLTDSKKDPSSNFTLSNQPAQPVNGWLSFQQYVEDNKRKPAGNPNLVGEVYITFNIDKKGVRSDYKVEKSLSPEHDAEAIRLVKEGPEWKLTRGRKARVTVLVYF